MAPPKTSTRWEYHPVTSPGEIPRVKRKIPPKALVTSGYLKKPSEIAANRMPQQQLATPQPTSPSAIELTANRPPPGITSQSLARYYRRNSKRRIPREEKEQIDNRRFTTPTLADLNLRRFEELTAKNSPQMTFEERMSLKRMVADGYIPRNYSREEIIAKRRKDKERRTVLRIAGLGSQRNPYRPWTEKGRRFARSLGPPRTFETIAHKAGVYDDPEKYPRDADYYTRFLSPELRTTRAQTQRDIRFLGDEQTPAEVSATEHGRAMEKAVQVSDAAQEKQELINAGLLNVAEEGTRKEQIKKEAEAEAVRRNQEAQIDFALYANPQTPLETKVAIAKKWGVDYRESINQQLENAGFTDTRLDSLAKSLKEMGDPYGRGETTYTRGYVIDELRAISAIDPTLSRVPGAIQVLRRMVQARDSQHGESARQLLEAAGDSAGLPPVVDTSTHRGLGGLRPSPATPSGETGVMGVYDDGETRDPNHYLNLQPKNFNLSAF